MRALTHDLADIIYLMLRQACPQALGQQLRALHTAFRTISTAAADETISLTIHNQDLSGFFTSISTERFLNSFASYDEKHTSRHNVYIYSLRLAVVESFTWASGGQDLYTHLGYRKQ